MVVWSLWITGTASATEITYSSLSAGDQTSMEQVLLDWSDNPGYVADATENEGLASAVVGGGIEEGLTGVTGGTGALIVGVPYITMRIADSLGIGGWAYRHFAHEDPSSCCGSSSASLTGIQWFYCPIPFTGSVGPPCDGYIDYNVVGWVAEALGTLSGVPSNFGARECVGGANFGIPNTSSILGTLPYIATGSSGFCNTGTDAIASAASTAPATEQQADAALNNSAYGYRETPATSSDWNNTPAAQQFTAPNPVNNTCNSTCLQAALNADNCGTPSLQNIVQAAGCNAIAKECGCAGDPGIQLQQIDLLQPLPNETYTAYEARLQGEGYLGTITNTVEGTSLSGYGPNAVTRVQYPDGYGNQQTLDPLNWPTTLPLLAPNTAITVRHNPTSATPAPSVSSPSPQCGSTTETACQVEEISTGPDNNVGTIDWTPLESLDLGSKFPFGVASYINSFFGSIPTSGSCPDLNINKPSALGGGTLSISFCNTAWETTYRPTVFLVLEALMTLAGVVFLAQKITGVGSTDE